MATKHNLNDTTPAAPAGKVLVRWQHDADGNISAYVDPPGAGGGGSQTPWVSDIDAAGFRLINTGNVGIGTASPTGILDVTANINPRANVTFLNTGGPGGSGKMRLRLGPSAGFQNTDLYPYIEAWSLDASQFAGLAFGTYATEGAATERMRITERGNVGIGTANAIQPLTVFRSGEVGIVAWNATGSGMIGVLSGESKFRVVNTGATGTLSGGLGFVIDMAGNVGIANAAPNALLDVAHFSTDPLSATSGAVTAFAVRGAANPTANSILMDIHETATPYGWIQAVAPGVSLRALALNPVGGNVGIGTASPGARLTVSGGGIQCTGDGWPVTGAGMELNYLPAIGMSAIQSYDRNAAAWKLLSLDASGIHLQAASGGNVGIGISPYSQGKLHVKTDTTDQRIRLQGPNATLDIFPNASGPAGPALYAHDGTESLSKNLRVICNMLELWFGSIFMPYLPSTNPGAGTKQLWYDPADGNRVKFAA